MYNILVDTRRQKVNYELILFHYYWYPSLIHPLFIPLYFTLTHLYLLSIFFFLTYLDFHFNYYFALFTMPFT